MGSRDRVTSARDSRGYDAGKKINGRKRLIVTYPSTSEAMIGWAALGGMLRGLSRGEPATRQQRRIVNAPY
ncbi:hypothetical protein DDE19_20070 [Micromonospora ureilytica]|uniref:Uncharacterized protein n=1 Tax=Micromonospora ureilytica TaxID=709868 RepID=A0A3N9XRJ1_9ACTN|nr:hypothetical protein DDE19_20070 [Micromonospora ureilytica]